MGKKIHMLGKYVGFTLCNKPIVEATQLTLMKERITCIDCKKKVAKRKSYTRKTKEETYGEELFSSIQ